MARTKQVARRGLGMGGAGKSPRHFPGVHKRKHNLAGTAASVAGRKRKVYHPKKKQTLLTRTKAPQFVKNFYNKNQKYVKGIIRHERGNIAIVELTNDCYWPKRKINGKCRLSKKGRWDF